MSLVTDANDTIRRLEAELAAYKAFKEKHESCIEQMIADFEVTLRQALDDRDNAARNERLRWADRAEALARARRDSGAREFDRGAAIALETLADELRAEGGGT